MGLKHASSSEPARKSFFWNLYARSYDALPRYLVEYRQLRQMVFRELEDRLSLGASVLDFGCGTGCYSLPLAEKGFAVTGMDISPAMLEAARRKAGACEAANPSFILHDGDTPLEAGRTFDAVIAVNVLYALEDPQAALRRIYRMLEPGGLLIAVVPCRAVPLADIAARTMAERGLLHTLRTGLCLGSVLLLNLVIGRRYRGKSYRLWDEAALRQDLDDAGFGVESVTEAYFATDLVAVARKDGQG